MQYDEDHESPDVIDRRGEGGGGGGGGGGSGIGMFALFSLLRTPYGWVVLVGVAIWWGLTHFGVLGGGGDARGAHGHPGGAYAASSAEKKEAHLVAFVLDDAQATWTRVFQAEGRGAYRHAKLVLFTDRTPTACGSGRAATGPFYCPGDERVYIDLGFFNELDRHLGAHGQFAQAYVIAHEIGHHVQHLLGTSDHVKGDSERGASGNSVRLELQADCYAGIWAHATQERKILQSGDIESAVNAAAAIGDDRLQRMGGGTAHPETFTHGSSAQRVRWFKRGFDSGKLASCDTFGAATL